MSVTKSNSHRFSHVFHTGEHHIEIGLLKQIYLKPRGILARNLFCEGLLGYCVETVACCICSLANAGYFLGIGCTDSLIEEEIPKRVKECEGIMSHVL